MRTRSIALLLAGLTLAAAATSCSKEGGFYKGIRFSARSTGYIGLPNTKAEAPDTKTSYTGVKDGTQERIDWTDGDIIRIASDKATVLNSSPAKHWSDFRVTSSTPSGATCRAVIQPSSDPNSLQWADGDNTFWAMYPSPSMSGVPDGTAFDPATGTMTFKVAAAQTPTKKDGEMTWLPNMKHAPMLAKKTTQNTSSGVSLDFSPQYTAFEFTVSKGSLEEVTLAGFSLTRMDDEGFTGNLSGTYTIAPADYSTAVTSASSTGTEITIDWSAGKIVLDEDNPEMTFTVFALPQTLKGLKIKFTGDFNKSGTYTQTRSLRLRSNTDEAIQFLPFLKYRIYGLSFPEMVDATVEDSINWDHSVAIMDSYIWWMDAGLDYTDWTQTPNGSRFAYLMDSFAWWIPSGVADDVAWEEIKDIRLDDDSDAYLWRHQTVTRTAYLRNYDDQTYSDVSVVWSAEQEGSAVYVNPLTGQVTARSPGEATVIATVTPNGGGDPWTASYKVYVNAPTAITLSAGSSSIASDGSTTLTATVTCTANGTIPALPEDLLEWSSATTAAVTLADAQAQPALASGQATATANGVAAGSSVVTVKAASKYVNDVTATLTITVE